MYLLKEIYTLNLIITWIFFLLQVCIFILVFIPTSLTGCVVLLNVFAAAVPDHRCPINGCDFVENPDYEDADKFGFLSFAIPEDVR